MTSTTTTFGLPVLAARDAAAPFAHPTSAMTSDPRTAVRQRPLADVVPVPAYAPVTLEPAAVVEAAELVEATPVKVGLHCCTVLSTVANRTAVPMSFVIGGGARSGPSAWSPPV